MISKKHGWFEWNNHLFSMVINFLQWLLCRFLHETSNAVRKAVGVATRCYNMCRHALKMIQKSEKNSFKYMRLK